MFCSKCGKPNPENTKSCQSCGTPVHPVGAGEAASTRESRPQPSAKRKMNPGFVTIFIIVGVIALLGIIFLNRGVEKAPKSTESPILYTPEEVIPGKIGDFVTLGSFIFRVDEIAFRKTIGNQLIDKTANGIFLLVKLRLQNTDTQEYTLDTSLFKLTDGTTEYECSAEGISTLELSGTDTLFLMQCQPNIQTSGYLVFEVPEEKVYHLRVSGGLWSGRLADIVLADKY